MAFKVFDACSIYPDQARTNANDKMTVKDYIFFTKIMNREKYSNLRMHSGGFRQRGAGSQL